MKRYTWACNGTAFAGMVELSPENGCKPPAEQNGPFVTEADHEAALKAAVQAALLRGVQEALVLHMARTDITIKEESARIVASLKEG